MKLLTSIIKLIIFLIIFNISVQNNSAQTVSTKRLSKLNQSIQSGFDSLKTRKWSEAETNFEAAYKIFEKEKQPSELLFDLIDVPDEDKSNPPTSATEQQITGYRHTVATKQALLQFLAFTYQLDGKTAQAQNITRRFTIYRDRFGEFRGEFSPRCSTNFLTITFRAKPAKMPDIISILPQVCCWIPAGV